MTRRIRRQGSSRLTRRSTGLDYPHFEGRCPVAYSDLPGDREPKLHQVLDCEVSERFFIRRKRLGDASRLLLGATARALRRCGGCHRPRRARGRPLPLHRGRDRTGLVSMLLLAIVDVAPEDIASDYGLSSYRLRARRRSGGRRPARADRGGFSAQADLRPHDDPRTALLAPSAPLIALRPVWATTNWPSWGRGCWAG
jgi:hypothetical protein